MDKVWKWVLAASFACALAAGNAGKLSEAVLDSGKNALETTMILAGTMMVWSGLMEILSRTGDVERLGRVLRRALSGLFPDVRDEQTWAEMSLNLAANMAGLGNAATPSGIRAARLLSGQGDGGARALAMLLALNNSSLQLLPQTVIALRQSAGAAVPSDIWGQALAASAVSTAAAAGLMTLFQRGGRADGRMDGGGGRAGGSGNRGAGHMEGR